MRHNSLAVALGLAASAAFLAGNAGAQTTIPANTTVTVTDPNAYYGAAGDITIENGATLKTVPSSQGTYTISNALIFGGTGGTIHLDFNDNDTLFTWTGPITSTATGPQTLAIATGVNGNGDREEVTFQTGIPDVGDATAMGLTVTFNAQTQSTDYVNLAGVNTFTGNITLTQGGNQPLGYLTIGGEGKSAGGNSYTSVPGSGNLGNGIYAGNISLGTGTNFVYSSSSTQELSGAISGLGVVRKDGSGTLTLSGSNSYHGNTTVTSGTLALAQTGGLTLYVANTSNSKITGAGTANLDGTLTIDTSAVTAPIASWTLIDVTNKTYGSNFNVPGFTNSGGVWTKVEGFKTWTFTQASGVLGVNTLATITSFGVPGHAGIIDNNALTISLSLPYLTDLSTLAPTFTVTSGSCDQTSGSPPSPTFAAQNPVTYTVTDGAATSAYVVTVTVAPAPPAGLGESAGLVAWYDASQLTGLSDGSSVDTWPDLSGYGHTATRTFGTMSYATNQVNGLPTVRFRSAGYANIFGTMFAKEQYIVFKSPNGNSYNGDWGAVMGDVTDQYGYMMGNGTNFWNGNYPSAVSQNGTVLASPWNISNMGSFLILKIDGTYPNTTPRNYSLGNVYGNGSPQYHNVNLDVAEVIAYDHVLSTGEAEQLGSYLTIKYGLSTNYAGLGDIVTFGIPGYPATINRVDKTIALTVPWVPWGTTGLSTLNPTFTLSSGTCDQTSGSPPSPNLFGGPNPVTYTVTDGAIVNTYTVTVTVQPPAPGGVGSGLALWLDASASDTMTLTDTTVTEWRDKMLSGAKMTTKGGAPTLTPSGIGSIPTVHFNTSAWMNDSVNHSTPVTIFYVSRQTGGTNARVLGAQNNWLMGYHGGQQNRFHYDGWVYDAGSTSGTNPHLYATTIGGSGQNSTVWAEGTQLASNQGGVTGPNNLQLNGYANSANETSDCDISEVLVYNRILTAGELISVGNYLAGKYSLTTTYPSLTYMGNVLFPGLGYAHPIDATPTGFRLQVPAGTPVTSLSPTYEILEGAGGNPASGTAHNFSTQQTYQITGTDSSTQNYTVAVVPYTGYAAKVIASNPFAYWPLNEGKGLVAYDNRGGNNGAYNATGVSYLVEGPQGPTGDTAASFSGAAGVAMSVPRAAALCPDGSFSVEMWVKPAAVPAATQPQYVAANVNLGTNRDGWYLAQDNGGTFGVAGNNFVVRMFNRNGSNRACQLYAPMDTVRWYHLVLTYDGDTKVARFYEDGVTNETDQYGKATLASYYGNSSTNPFTVAKRSDGALPWAGTAAQVAFYTRALTQQEILNHLQAVPTYADWATQHAGGQAANLDYNHDGVQNGIAYFMNATGQATLPGPDANKKVTWTNGGNIPSSAYGTQFVVQTSTDLATWTNVSAGDGNLSNTAGSVAYTLPSGQGKVFCRLVVTPQ